MVVLINLSLFSYFFLGSFVVVGLLWWLSYNLSEFMESWFSFIKNNSMCGYGKKFCGLNF